MNEEITLPKEYFITIGTFDKNNIQFGIPLSSTIGRIQMVNNDMGNHFAELLESGEFILEPYGYGNKDENGVINDFNLLGFNIMHK